MEYIEDLSSLKFVPLWNRIKIIDSYKVKKSDFEKVFEIIKTVYNDIDLLKNRTTHSLKMEWAVHNFLYKLKFKPEKTKDVDLDYYVDKSNKLYMILYNILGPLVWVFIK